jgi:hypothetical protein
MRNSTPIVPNDSPAVLCGTYRYVWGNNEKRRALKGRACVIEATGNLGSAQIRFLDDGSREIVSRRALRLVKSPAIGRNEEESE